MKLKTDKNLQEVKEMLKEIESLPNAIHNFQVEAMSSLTTSIQAKKSIKQKHDRLVNYIRSHKKALETSHSLCINKLNQITRASTCNICSGRSQLFFNGKKILMKEGECRAIIGSCEEAWRSVVHILGLLHDYTNQVKGSFKGELSKEHFDSLKSFENSHNLSKNFEKCPKLKDCSTNIVGNICERLVSILTPSYADLVKKTLKETRKTLVGKFLQKIGKFFADAGKAVVNGIKHIGKKIGNLFKKKKKKKGKAQTSNSNTIQTSVPAPTQTVPSQTWALSARDRLSKLGSERLLQTDGGEGSADNQCTDTILTGCDTDVMVSRGACTTCPDYGWGDLP